MGYQLDLGRNLAGVIRPCRPMPYVAATLRLSPAGRTGDQGALRDVVVALTKR